MKQDMKAYTANDKQVWKTLFERQFENLQTKGSQKYLDCLYAMQPVLNANEIPDFNSINAWFTSSTGWSIEVVPGMIPVVDFFDLLAAKKFCSSTWLRRMDQLDYIEEPDMFHDIFGHIPLLSNPVFAEFAQRFGKLGQCFKDNPIALNQLQRLYWFTIEFGLILEDGKPLVYGAGIMSSFGETNRIAEQACNVFRFDIDEILRKSFQNDVLQEDYFIIDSLEQLNSALKDVQVHLTRKIIL